MTSPTLKEPQAISQERLDEFRQYIAGKPPSPYPPNYLFDMARDLLSAYEAATKWRDIDNETPENVRLAVGNPEQGNQWVCACYSDGEWRKNTPFGESLLPRPSVYFALPDIPTPPTQQGT